MPQLPWSEFVAQYRAGQVTLGLDKVKAHQLVEHHMPKRFRYAAMFWGYVAMLLFVGGVVSFFVWGWMYGIAGVALGIITFNATRKSNYQFVQRQVLENEAFYKLCLENEAISVRPRTTT